MGILRMEGTKELPLVILYNDDMGALSTFADGSLSPHSCQIGVKYYSAHNVVMERREVDMCHCEIEDILADGLARGLSIWKHSLFILYRLH